MIQAASDAKTWARKKEKLGFTFTFESNNEIKVELWLMMVSVVKSWLNDG